jgi:hypothetical protein
MRVKVQKIGDSDPSNGVTVELVTVTGPHRLVVADHQVAGDSVPIGFPLRRDNELVYVALPRPTLSGSFRVWVRAEDVLPNTVFAPARAPDLAGIGRAVVDAAETAFAAAADMLVGGAADRMRNRDLEPELAL